MKRRFLHLAAALSLLLSIAAALAWATSHAGSPRWHLVATAHSADLARAGGEPGTARFVTAAGWSAATNHGFWDAWWALSRAGRLTLLAQVIDYDGTLRRVDARPPSLVVLPPDSTRSPVVVFARAPGPGAWERRLGFGWHADARAVGDVSVRAWIVTLPWWLPVALGMPLPLWWWRATRRPHAVPPRP